MSNSLNFKDQLKSILMEKLDIGVYGYNRKNAVKNRAQQLFEFLQNQNLLNKATINKEFFDELNSFLAQKYLGQNHPRRYSSNTGNDPLASIFGLFQSTPQPKYLSDSVQNISYQVRKEVMDDLRELIEQHFSLQSCQSSENYPAPATKLHQTPSLQIISSSPDNKPYNQNPQQNYTSQNPIELNASSHNQQGSAIQRYPKFKRFPNLYNTPRDQESQSLKSSLGIINADLQRDFIEFENIYTDFKNFHPFGYEITWSKLHDFQKIIKLSNSIRDKTFQALTIIDKLFYNGFIDFEKYDRHQKALRDGLSIFTDDFNCKTLDIFQPLIEKYYTYQNSPHQKIKTLHALFEINQIAQTDDRRLFQDNIKNILNSQFNDAVEKYLEEAYLPVDLIEIVFQKTRDSQAFVGFMKNKIQDLPKQRPSSSPGQPSIPSRPPNPIATNIQPSQL